MLLECHLVFEPEQADVVVVRVLVVDSSSREDRLAVEDVASFLNLQRMESGTMQMVNAMRSLAGRLRGTTQRTVRR